jgi:primosomal protein N' (replication factor Y)
MIKITLRHKDQYLLTDAANLFAKQLKMKLGDAVLGPEFPNVARLKGQYQKQIMLKLDRKLMAKNVKAFVLKQADHVFLRKEYARIRVIYDVDPN